jgi:tetrapyrrole methylase family protein / MazG family protein
VLGLGPGDAGYLTADALDHLQSIDSLTLRTSIHPTVPQLPTHLRLESFDDLYESAPDFETIYQTIADTLIDRVVRGETITYAVPGHPLVAEATTRHLLSEARERGVAVRTIAGLSFVEPVCEALAIDPFADGLQLIDALDLRPAVFPTPESPDQRAWVEIQRAGAYESPYVPFPLVATRPALVGQVYSRRVASAAKLALLERYPADHPLAIVRAAGVAGETAVSHVPLHELDHESSLDHLSVVYVPALANHTDARSLDGLQWVVARLLGPAGCPWDREQTHRSLRPFLLEEAHELLEALDAGDDESLSEELGDLLLQILMHSEMARQAGTFDLGDVTTHITAKLIRRHPHVFGDLAVEGSGEVLRNWEAIKQQERAAKGQTPKGLLDGIPVSLPSLAAAQKIGEKVAKVGFDWPDLDGVWAKIHEEIAELRSAARHERSEEFGDLLFVIARLASWLDIDAETALREANAKFRRRYAACERLADGRDLRTLSFEELDQLWKAAKQATG